MISILFSAGPLAFIVIFGSLVATIAVHEFAHALAADKLGDPTPRIQGRLTLDPRAHLDLVGTVAMLITWFGWGKPGQFDPYNLKNPRKDAALIGLAGPASNITVAILFSLILSVLPPSLLVWAIMTSVIRLNLVLAIFNLVPIHPLDGGKILIGFLPRDLADEWNAILSQYGMIFLVLLILPFGGTSPISYLISPVLNAFFSILIP